MRVASVLRSVALLTVEAICSRAAEVSSSDAACCSVLRDRFSALERISLALSLIAEMLSLTSLRVSPSFSIDLLKSIRTASSSSVKGVSRRVVRSPSARRFRATASWSTAALTFALAASRAAARSARFPLGAVTVLVILTGQFVLLEGAVPEVGERPCEIAHLVAALRT